MMSKISEWLLPHCCTCTCTYICAVGLPVHCTLPVSTYIIIHHSITIHVAMLFSGPHASLCEYLQANLCLVAYVIHMYVVVHGFCLFLCPPSISYSRRLMETPRQVPYIGKFSWLPHAMKRLHTEFCFTTIIVSTNSIITRSTYSHNTAQLLVSCHYELAPLQYLDGVPDPRGTLSVSVQLQAIAEAIHGIQEAAGGSRSFASSCFPVILVNVCPQRQQVCLYSMISIVPASPSLGTKAVVECIH